jgi:hypothetical protein
MIEKHNLQTIKTASIVIEGKLNSSTKLQGPFSCVANKFFDVEWTLRNLKKTDITLFVRVLPVQQGELCQQPVENESYINRLKSDIVLWAGTSEFIVKISAGSEKRVMIKALITSAATVQFLCHAEEMGVQLNEKLITKSKYEAPTLLLGCLEKVLWI